MALHNASLVQLLENEYTTGCMSGREEAVAKSTKKFVNYPVEDYYILMTEKWVRFTLFNKVSRSIVNTSERIA